jgi:hypothetical protein
VRAAVIVGPIAVRHLLGGKRLLSRHPVPIVPSMRKYREDR